MSIPIVGALVDGAIDLWKAYNPPPASEADKAAYAQAEVNFKVQYQQLVANSIVALENEITKRHAADMSSDSWLSKNIRPMVLVYLLLLFTGFAIVSASFNLAEVYIEMLKEMLQMAFGFYFAGRTIEKVTSILKGISK